MDLDGVRRCLTEGYERINSMKNSITKVETCRARLKLKGESVQEEVTYMMNKMAVKLYKLQQSIEHTVKDTITERERSLDAKKKEIHDGYAHLVQVCVEADKVLRGRSTDILGRSCQRLFSKFEAANVKLNMAEKVDTEGVLAFQFQDNSREFLSSVCVARLQHFGKPGTVTEVDEFWVDYQSGDQSHTDRCEDDPVTSVSNKMNQKPVELQRSPDNDANISPRQALETIQEVPEDSGLLKEHRMGQQHSHGPQSGFDIVHICEKDLCVNNSSLDEHFSSSDMKPKSSTAVYPPPGFPRLRQSRMQSLDVQHNIAMQPGLFSRVGCLSNPDTSLMSGSAARDSDCFSDASHSEFKDDASCTSADSAFLSSKMTGSCSYSTQSCGTWPMSVDKKKPAEGSRDEDFIWNSDDSLDDPASDSELALKAKCVSNEKKGNKPFCAAADTCSGSVDTQNHENVTLMTDKQQGPVHENSNTDWDCFDDRQRQSNDNTHINDTADNQNLVEESLADMQYKPEPCQDSSYITENMHAVSLATNIKEVREKKKVKQETGCVSIKTDPVEAEQEDITGEKVSEIARPVKARCKRLDLSHLLEHAGGNVFEIPAKCVEIIRGDFDHPIGVCTNSKGDVIIADTNNHNIKVFNNGRVINKFGADVRMRRPSAVVVNEKDEVFVKDDHCLFHFDADGNFIKTIGKRMMNTPYGLAMTKDRDLVIVDALYSNARMHICGQDGAICTYPYLPLCFQYSDSKCRFLATHGGEVLTSDLGRSCLYVTNLKGELVRTVGRLGRRPGELNQPAGVAVDSVGNWVVADSKNHRVQVFAPNGYFLATLRFSGTSVHRPSGIHLTSDGLLYVINYIESVIKVFKLGAS